MEMELEYGEMLDKAEKSIRTADHMVYVTYPLLKENKLLKKVIEGINIATLNIIDALLFYNYKYKLLGNHKDEYEKWENFKRAALKAGITMSEIESVKRILELMKKHKNSSFEFMRKDRLVVMSDNLRTESIGLEDLKSNLNLMKSVLKKTKEHISKKIF